MYDRASIYGLQMWGDESLSSVTEDGHWKTATTMIYHTINLRSVSERIAWEKETSIPGEDTCHMGSSADRRWLFPTRNWTFGVAIGFLLFDLHICDLILRDCHNMTAWNRSVRTEELIACDLPIQEVGRNIWTSRGGSSKTRKLRAARCT